MFLVFSICSCAPFSAPDRSAPHQDLPANFSLGEAVAAPEQRWWLEFSSPRLNALIDEALAGNLSLRAYWARLERAGALAGRVAGDLLPALSGEGSASYRESGNDSASASGQNYSLGLFASYELDLWGRVGAGVKSAGLSLQATREDLNAAAMTIAAEAARCWLGILARRQELSLLQQQLEINRTYLELVELRFLRSFASAQDVMQQRQLVERVLARIPLVQMEEQTLRNELAVLTGKMPGEPEEIAALPLPVLPGLPKAGVPAGLLHNRPDIRAALKRLEAADQNLVVAEANRLPAVRLTGSVSDSGSELDRILDNWLLNLAASLTAPLFDGDRRKYEVDAAKAAVDEQLALYRQTVLAAVREVEDALVREEKIREHIGRSDEQLQSARAALDEARAHYMNGLTDYLPVLTQLLSVQNLEMDLVSRREDLLAARISLYRGLGGTWAGELVVPATDSSTQQDG